MNTHHYYYVTRNLTEKVREEKGNGTADDLSALFSQALAKA